MKLQHTKSMVNVLVIPLRLSGTKLSSLSLLELRILPDMVVSVVKLGLLFFVVFNAVKLTSPLSIPPPIFELLCGKGCIYLLK